MSPAAATALPGCGTRTRAGKADRSGFADLPLCVAFCGETNRLITGDWTGTIRVLDAKDGKQIGTLDPNPFKLADRLDAALKRIAVRQPESKTLSTAFESARVEAEKQQSRLSAVQKTFDTAQANWKQAAATSTQAQATVASLNAGIQSAAKIVAALDPALPALKEAAEKGTQAAATIAGDSELAAAAAKLKSQYDLKRKQFEEAKQALAAQTARIQESARDVTAAVEREEGLKSVRDVAKKTLDEVSPVAKAAQTKFAAARRAPRRVHPRSRQVGKRRSALERGNRLPR